MLIEAAGIIWLVTGIIAGVLDYAFAAGFGLVASIVLSGVLGYDPRSVAGAAALAQILSAIPMLLIHNRMGNLSSNNKYLYQAIALFALASTVAALVFSTTMLMLPGGLVALLYTILLATLAILLYNISNSEKDPPRRNRKLLALLYGVLAGVYKALVGGGYSAVIVAAQKKLGLDIKSAIASMPLVKLPAFTLVALVYGVSGRINPLSACMLVIGAIASTPLAANLLHRSPTNLVTKAIAVIVGSVSIAKIIYLVL